MAASRLTALMLQPWCSATTFEVQPHSQKTMRSARKTSQRSNEHVCSIKTKLFVDYNWKNTLCEMNLGSRNSGRYDLT